MLLHLLAKPITVFKRIDSGEFSFSTGIVILFFLIYSCLILLNGNDSYSSLLSEIPLVGLEFVFLYYISPFIFSKFSRLIGGVANNRDMRIVLLNNFYSDSFSGSVAFLDGFGSLFQFKILILGLAYYNKFSIKHALMVLITLSTFILLLRFLIT